MGNGDIASAGGGGEATAGGFLSTALANGADSQALATGGISETATASGTNAVANAVNGIGDVASVIGTGSTAISGSGGDWDLAAVFGNLLAANATGGNFLLDLLPSL